MPVSRRPIRDAEARLDPATTWLRPREPVTHPIPTVRLDDPDPSTPLFDALWSVWGMSGRHARTPTGEVPMGKHYDADGDGLADQDKPAETAGQEDHSDPWVFAGEDADAPEDAA